MLDIKVLLFHPTCVVLGKPEEVAVNKFNAKLSNLNFILFKFMSVLLSFVRWAQDTRSVLTGLFSLIGGDGCTLKSPLLSWPLCLPGFFCREFSRIALFSGYAGSLDNRSMVPSSMPFPLTCLRSLMYLVVPQMLLATSAHPNCAEPQLLTVSRALFSEVCICSETLSWRKHVLTLRVPRSIDLRLPGTSFGSSFRTQRLHLPVQTARQKTSDCWHPPSR